VLTYHGQEPARRVVKRVVENGKMVKGVRKMNEKLEKK
jgi:hypothetical protein